MPSISPTGAPTYAFKDCVTSCAILEGSAYATIAAGNVLNEIKLSTNFKLTFDVSVSGLGVADEYRNILDLKDTQSGDSLLKVFLTETNNLRVEYGGILYITSGSPMVTPFSSFTTFEIWVLHGSLSVTSSADEDSSEDEDSADVHAISGPEIVTESSSYYLYASSASDPTADGALMNFVITGKNICEIACCLVHNRKLIKTIGRFVVLQQRPSVPRCRQRKRPR